MDYVMNKHCFLGRFSMVSGDKRMRRDVSHPDRNKIVKKYRKQAVQKRRQFEDVLLKSISKPIKLFTCPSCNNVLQEPITVECGHTFCSKCVSSPGTCVVCQKVLVNGNSVNVLLQKLLDRWRENTSTYNIAEHIFAAIGVEPRYRLRTRYAGFHFKQDCVIRQKIFKMKEHSNFILKKCYPMDVSQNKSLKRNELRKSRKEKHHHKNFDESLRHILEEVENIQEKSLKTHWKNGEYDLDCILCGQCMLEPVTTACGHSFCRECLTRVLDHRLCCPLCMTDLNLDDYFRGITVGLDDAIRYILPVERRKRVLARLKEIHKMENKFEVPVFICTNAFPGVACPLYVYEPQYRLLTRRCLRTFTRKFAMVARDNQNEKFVSYGTLLEVKDAVRLQDGRFILATVGIRRFKVVGRGEQDGYDTAKIHYIKDVTVPPEKVQEITLLHRKVHNKASKWVSSLTPKVCEEVERLIGQMPDIETNWLTLPDGPSWTWWLMPILPLSSQLQVVFLSTTSLEKRLRAIDKMLEHMKIRMKALERDTINNENKQETLDDACDDYV